MARSTSKPTLTKQPAEKRKYAIDFVNLLTNAVGDVLDGISSIKQITSEQIGGGATDLSITSSGISGTQVQFWIESGTQGNRYRIEAQVNTSGTAILAGDGILKVSTK